MSDLVLNRPTREELEFIRASGVLAVFCVRDRGGNLILGAGDDPWASPALAGGILFDVIWTLDSLASRLHADAAAWLERVVDGLDDFELRATFRACGGVPSTPHEEALAQARVAVEQVNERIDEMQRRGDLKQMNREYRARRRSGVRQRPYSAHLEDLRLSLIRSAAQEISKRAIASARTL